MISIIYTTEGEPRCLDAGAHGIEEARERIVELKLQKDYKLPLKVKEFDSFEDSMNYFAVKGELYGKYQSAEVIL